MCIEYQGSVKTAVCTSIIPQVLYTVAPHMAVNSTFKHICVTFHCVLQSYNMMQTCNDTVYIHAASESV